MPWCPQCGEEYREGFKECSECHVPLVDRKPEIQEPEPLGIMEKPVKVFTAENRLEAEAVEDMLRGNGIAVMDRPAAFGQIQAYSGADARFGLELLVDESQAEQALELIEERKFISAIPFDENELARLAEEQALSVAKQETEDNVSFKLLPVILGVIVLLLILLYMVVKI